MSHNIGRIDEFQPDSENITTYLERIDLFLSANDVAENKKVPALLSCIGPKTYSILKNLTSPELPSSKSLVDLTITIFSNLI